MNTQPYTSRVNDIVRQLKQKKAECPEDFRVSDIFDDAGNQYVNLIQEGGGVLGVALIGFTYILEEMGIRFLSLGGTSAGSINTLLMADTGNPGDKKSLKVLERIAGKDFMDFIDGGADARALVNSLDDRFALGRITHAVRNLDELTQRYGINPGEVFEKWLVDQLTHDTWASLRQNVRALPEELILMDNFMNQRQRLTPEDLEIQLGIVAADITTQTKVEFPAMADLYYEYPERQNPASFVRASMSIPLFFEPQRIDLSWATANPAVEDRLRAEWSRRADYQGQLPNEVLLVDGGTMSNFPIDLFHREDQIPTRPTLGIRLGVDRKGSRATNSVFDFVANMFEGVRNLRDQEFLVNNPEYRTLISHVDVEGYNFLDFGISDADKIELFERGAQAAERFLKRFHWLEYKNQIKNSLLQAIKPLMWELSAVKSLEEKLDVLGIQPSDEIIPRIEKLMERPEPYNVLWIDDAFTYALPVAILDSLNIACSTVQNSEDARTLLAEKNGPNADEARHVDLILTDLTRKIMGKRNSIAGILFSEEIYFNENLRDIPVIIYAHTGTEIIQRYRRVREDDSLELPPNVKNEPDLNTNLHSVLIREVVNNIYATHFE